MSARSRTAEATLLGVAGLLAASGAFSLHSRITYGTWDPTAQPARIEFCGRRYYAGAPATVTREWAMGGVDPSFGATWREVGRTDGGVPLYAMVVSESTRNRFSPPIPCTMMVFLQTGRDSYRRYGLSGGP
jgi:hypothetical protein